MERNKVSEFLRGNIFAHDVNDHGAEEQRRVLEDRPQATHETGFYSAQTGHSHFAAIPRPDSLTHLTSQPKMAE